MPISILMPALSPTMTEGNLARWLKREGETVAAGDILAEIETDKATMEVEAVDEGTLGRILVKEGTEGIAVNTPIAVLLEEGEDKAALKDFEAAPAAKPAAPKDPEQSQAKPAAKEAGAAPEPASPKGADAPDREAAGAKATAAPAAARGDGGRILASPLARRMAAEAGIDLTGVAGSGPNGRIVKADIAAAAAAGTGAPEARVRAPEAPPAPGDAGAAYSEIPLTSMRKVIARRLVEAKQTIPHFYLSIDCEIDGLLDVRARLNRDRGADEKLSVNDFVIRASALALAQVPDANASWTDTAIRRYHSVDIAVAVAIEGGLITPVVRHADHKGLAEIGREMRDLAERARAGKLAPEEYQGGTFSISNLGMYGIKDFAAVINPPQGAILAVGQGGQRPVVRDGALAIATVMSCTLSCDHRVVDGAVGAAFLAAFKRLIEDPLKMLL